MKNPLQSQSIMNNGKKNLFAMALLLFCTAIITHVDAQLAGKSVQTKSLEINFFKTTSIIFPEAIENVDRGSRDILAQKAKGIENILQLKAGRKDFTETNLTVITADGGLHHFLITYAPQPKELIIDLSQHHASQQGTSVVIFSAPIDKEALAEYADNILSAKSKYRLAKKKVSKIHFSLQNIFIHDHTAFYHFKIKNRSNIAYDIDFLRFTIKDKTQVKRTASQEVEVKPVYVHGDAQGLVAGQSEIDLVYALEKFTIPEAKYLAIELFEANGGRNLELQIKNRMIINARPISIQENNTQKHILSNQ